MPQFCSLLAGIVLIALAIPAHAAGADASVVRRVATVRADPSTGRLVRRVAVQSRVIQPVIVKADAPTAAAPAAEEKPNPLRLSPDASVNEIVDAAAKRYQVDPLLVHSVIQVESAYNQYAVSSAGAQGLMQLIPSTARELGVKNPFDARENIEAGVRYLKQLQMQFKDDRLALAAYNAGGGAVVRYGTIPPYAETQNYVYQVGKRWGAARRASQSLPAKIGTASQGKAEAPKVIEQYTDAEGRLHLRMR
jgi:soluble lytic murein transglycosylase-like protein